MNNAITVRRAVKSDVPAIIEFIREQWNPDHIFVKEPAFFEYMLCDGDEVNVIIAADLSGKIFGMEGVTFYNSSDRPDSTGMMWKCLKTENVMLGIEIDQYMASFKNQRFHFGVGSNPKTTLKITRKFYKHVTGKLDHFYRLSRKQQFRIALIRHAEVLPQEENGVRLLEVLGADELEKILPDEYLRSMTPYKDLNYLRRRYFEHPIYRYRVYGIEHPNRPLRSVLVMRVVEAAGSRAIKIVDFIGDNSDLAGIGDAVDRQMEQFGAEYTDIYSAGLNDELMEQAGFVRLTDGDSNIIPNYFEPFEQRNVDIYYTAPYMENVRLFRGDADQDRPNTAGGLRL